MTGDTIAERLAAVRARIETAAKRAGRTADEVTLVAVTKLVHPATIAEAVDLGVRDLGESYVKEALAKQADARIKNHELRWHFIGHLQRNKAKDVVDKFALIHGVDSVLLARELGKRARQLGREANILLQVKLDPAPTKFGIPSVEIQRVADTVIEVAGVRVLGLMGIPPFNENAEASRVYFRSLRRLFDSLPTDHGKVLSMGMTGDFEVAIEEGATLVRIGTAIFGPRTDAAS